MIASAEVQNIALKRLISSRYRITLDDATRCLEELNSRHSYKLDVQIDNMLRMSDIEKCNKILEEIECERIN